MAQNPYDRWWQIDATFSEALTLPAGARAAFLDEACEGDAGLRREVEHLLAAHAASEAYLEDPGDWLAAPLLPGLDVQVDAGTVEGSAVGPYRVLGEIGRGGMGAVYLAERADGQFRQRVALKLIRKGLVTEDALRRFRLEREILARLQHPHIARLLDGGVTEDGRPYFVMEYVEGRPITHYCDAHKLGIGARLALFRDVCAAVHYAHQNLVVHRDLTPGNILVTEAPGSGLSPRRRGSGQAQVKLLDFGIAKLLDEASAPVTAPVTGHDVRLMTPEYASPEQVRGAPITTASDVYQLGVVLYELLTGHRPYSLTGRLLHEIERVICEAHPEKPSTAVTAVSTAADGDGTTRPITPETVSRARAMPIERLRRRLSGDLDTIVLMALRKEPARRYTSAEALADDLRRHLEGLPVRARPDTLGYRAAKFIRRHRLGIGAATVIAVILIGFGVAMVAQAARIARERDRAEDATAFLASLLESFEPAQAHGSLVETRHVLGRAVRRIRTELDDQPLVQATLMDVLGQVYQYRGQYAEADSLLHEALALRLRHRGTGHLDVAVSRFHLAALLERMGAYETADTLYLAAIDTYRRRLGYTHPDVIYPLSSRAGLLRARGDYTAAEALFREILATYAEPLGDHLDVATSMLDLGKLLVREERYDEAEPLLREALAMRRRLVGAVHPIVANGLDALGVLAMERGDLAAADSFFTEALGIRRTIFEEDHPDLAASFSNLAEVRHRTGAYAEAERLYHDALASYRRAFGEQHPDVVYVMRHLASTLDAQGRSTAADSLRRALQDRQSHR